MVRVIIYIYGVVEKRDPRLIFVIGSAFEAGTFYAGGAYNLMLAEPHKRQRSS